MDWVCYWPLGVLAVVLAAAAVSDVRTGRIGNVLTYAAILIGLGGHTAIGAGAGGHAGGLIFALLGLAMGATLVVVWLAGGIGGGDVKLMAGIGALAGWKLALSTMFWGFAAAAVMAMIVMLRRRIVRQTLGRVFRFIVLAFSPLKPVDPALPDSPKIPFGAALCIGAAAAVTEALVRGGKAALMGMLA